MAPASHDDVSHQSSADAADDSRIAAGGSGANGRVLLLEDDAALQEVIKAFLVETGYSVVACANGREGVQQLLSADFVMILCDMAMPTMPGEMFYRAVERINPQLCERFVFMTGFRGDEKTNDFIKRVGGFVLRKPFPMSNLVDAISLVEVRRTFRSVVEEPELAAPGIPPESALLIRMPQVHAPRPREQRVIAEACTPIRSAEPAPPFRLRMAEVAAASRLPRNYFGGRAMSFLWICLLLVPAAVLHVWYPIVRNQAAAAVGERDALAARWTVVSAGLPAVEAQREKLQAELGQPARIAADRSRPRWTPALRAIATAAGEEIVLQHVSARGEPEDNGACELRVSGVALGARPWLAAEQFQQAVETGLKQIAGGQPVSVRMERLEDASAAPREPRQALFAFLMAVGVVNAPSPTTMKGQ
jgi:CheY-like chemotaxis protein